MSHPRRLAALVLSELLASGCRYVDTGYRGGPGPTVLVVGDSLTVIGAGRLHDRLDPDRRVQVNAALGRRWDELGPIAATLPASDVEAVLLGTNLTWVDGARVASWDEERAVIETSYTPTAPCVVMATVTPTKYRTEAWTAALNAWIVAHATVVVDWAGAAAADPSLLSLDRIHPSDAGADRWSTLVADAVRRCPAPSPAG